MKLKIYNAKNVSQKTIRYSRAVLRFNRKSGQITFPYYLHERIGLTAATSKVEFAQDESRLRDWYFRVTDDVQGLILLPRRASKHENSYYVLRAPDLVNTIAASLCTSLTKFSVRVGEKDENGWFSLITAEVAKS